MQNKKLFADISNVTVVGDGGWGTAIGLHLNRKGKDVVIWSPFQEYAEYLRKNRKNIKFLPKIKIPNGIKITSSLERALTDIDLIVVAIPSKYLRSIINRMAPFYSQNIPIVSVSKGIEIDSFKRMSEIIEEILAPFCLGVLSGPSHAEEVALQLPASVMVASINEDFLDVIQILFNSDLLRVYKTDDVIGVELGGALKNVVAIAAGICDGLKLGSNAKSALLTGGFNEIIRLGVVMGGRIETFLGLSGIGDLVTTCISSFGRNWNFGVKLAQGLSLQEILSSTDMVIEGVKNAESIYFLSKELEVEMPIINEVYKIIHNEKSPQKAVRDLMTRRPTGVSDLKSIL
ncbi:NAD(P)H-dependent glycerol-3-phosphate dehydrogenase, partial [Chlamydiota bacterium]